MSTAPAPGTSQVISGTIDIPVNLAKAGKLGLTASGENAEGSELKAELGKVAGVHVAFPDGNPDPRTFEVGSKFKEKLSFMGMPADVEWTVTEWNPLESAALAGEGPMGTQITASGKLALVEGGVKVDYEITIGGAAVAAMLPTIAKQVETQIADVQTKAQQLLS